MAAEDLSHDAAAAAGHGEAAAGHGEAATAAFPPFDATLFPHQLFWFLLSFVALYLIMSRVVLPAVAGVIAARDKVVKTDLDAAAAASSEAETAKAAAEQAAAAGRAKARALIDAARAEVQAEFAAEQAKTEKRLSDRAATAEKRIGETRQKALTEVSAVADDLAKDIAARVTGGAVEGMAR